MVKTDKNGLTYVNVKLENMDEFLNYIILSNGEYFCGVNGLLGDHYLVLVPLVLEFFENITPRQLLQKLEMNNCKIQIGELVFSL